MAHVLDLLAEVEGALSDVPSATRRPSRHAATPAPMIGSGGASTSASAAPPPRVHAPAGDRNARRGKSEVDELLAMLDDEPGGPSLPRVPSSVHVRGSSTGSDAEPRGCGAGSKCTSVYLGAAAAELGQTRATTRRCVGVASFSLSPSSPPAHCAAELAPSYFASAATLSCLGLLVASGKQLRGDTASRMGA